MKKLGMAALAGAAALMGEQTFADTLSYEVVPGVPGTNGFTQQSGNAAYEYGDEVHGLLGCVDPKIYIDFGFFTYDAATYTPTVQVDLYNADTNGDPFGLPFATASNSSLTFTGSNYNGGGTARNTEQSMCFDFTGVTLPNDFVFAYRDNAPLGTISPGFGFSVFVSSGNSTPLLPGQEILPKHFYRIAPGPNADSSANLGGYNIQASITCVPEPTTAGLLALGGSLMATRRRRV